VDRPWLIVVTGPPASGKSSTARAIAAGLGVPLLSKDEVKERLYETFGSGDELEGAVDAAGLSVVLSLAATQLAAGVSVVAESNFDARRDAARFRRLLAEHPARVLQVYVGGEPAEVAEAFAERAAAGRRHPGHRDSPADAATVRRELERGRWDPLGLPGELVRADGREDDETVARIRSVCGL
jgi:predicted kinase